MQWFYIPDNYYIDMETFILGKTFLKVKMTEMELWKWAFQINQVAMKDFPLSYAYMQIVCSFSHLKHKGQLTAI